MAVCTGTGVNSRYRCGRVGGCRGYGEGGEICRMREEHEWLVDRELSTGLEAQGRG